MKLLSLCGRCAFSAYAACTFSAPAATLMSAPSLQERFSVRVCLRANAGVDPVPIGPLWTSAAVFASWPVITLGWLCDLVDSVPRGVHFVYLFVRSAASDEPGVASSDADAPAACCLVAANATSKLATKVVGWDPAEHTAPPAPVPPKLPAPPLPAVSPPPSPPLTLPPSASASSPLMLPAQPPQAASYIQSSAIEQQFGGGTREWI